MQSSSIVGAHRHGSTFQSGQHARFPHRRAHGCHSPSDPRTVKWSSDVRSCCSSDTGSVRSSSGSASRRLGPLDGASASAPAHHSRAGMPEENPARVDARAAHEVSRCCREDWTSNCGPSHNPPGASIACCCDHRQPRTCTPHSLQPLPRRSWMSRA